MQPPRAKVIQRGENHDIPVTVMTRAEINDRDTMLNTLRQYGISHIILAGFMIMLPNFLIQAYPDKDNKACIRRYCPNMAARACMAVTFTKQCMQPEKRKPE